MSYSSNHQRVADKRRPGVLVGGFVVCCLLTFVSGCVVTSVGGKTACPKCGRQSGSPCRQHQHGSVQETPYTPTRVTEPEVEIPAGEILPSPTEFIIPQSSNDSKDWRPVVIRSNSEPVAPKPIASKQYVAKQGVPIQTTARSVPSGSGQPASDNLLTAFMSTFSSPFPATSTPQQKPVEQPYVRQIPAAQQQVRPPSFQRVIPAPNVSSPLETSQPPKPISSTGSSAVRPLPPTSMVRPRSTSVQQVSHEIPLAVPMEPKRLNASLPVNRVSPSSKASPELHKPWDMDEFRPRYTATENPYRLVSDTTQQSDSSRSAPPSIDIRRLTRSSQPTSSNASLAQSSESHYPRMPILGLGHELVKEFRPSNDRKWSQNHAVLQTASFNGNFATVHNVRYSKYEDGKIVSTRYYDATFNLNDIRTIDLVIVPFRGAPRLAHVQASFGFADGRHIGMSIEARYEEGEQYDALGSTMRQFELIYVLADERDLLRIGSEVNKNDVHLYRLKFEPSEVREMFIDALNRANKLSAEPEFYHPLRNSCVTNLIAHINKGRPKAVPKEYRTLLPGLLDNYAYDLKLVDTTAKTFKEAKENAKVNWLVEKFGDLEYFSAGIRQNMY